MKWFDKWLIHKMKQAWDDNLCQPEEEAKYSNNTIGLNRKTQRGTAIRVDDSLQSRGTNFTMYNANGGTVVELRSYNETTDRNSIALYVISSDKDLGQELGHIVTMEALKR